jgi:hypothetical protein
MSFLANDNVNIGIRCRVQVSCHSDNVLIGPFLTASSACHYMELMSHFSNELIVLDGSYPLNKQISILLMQSAFTPVSATLTDLCSIPQAVRRAKLISYLIERRTGDRSS